MAIWPNPCVRVCVSVSRVPVGRMEMESLPATRRVGVAAPLSVFRPAACHWQSHQPHSVRNVIIHHAGALSARLCAIVRCCGIIFVRFFALRMILVFSKPELSTRVSPPRRPMRPRSANNMNIQL